MFQSLALALPFLIAFGGVVLFLHLVRRGLNVRNEAYEKNSARIWLLTSVALLVVGPLVHGIAELCERLSISDDVAIGGWMLLGMVWLLFDWDRTWERLREYGLKWGQSTQSSALLLKFVTSGVVVTSYLFLMFSMLGIEMPAR
jgi:hypothetical protein